MIRNYDDYVDDRRDFPRALFTTNTAEKHAALSFSTRKTSFLTIRPSVASREPETHRIVDEPVGYKNIRRAFFFNSWIAQLHV